MKNQLVYFLGGVLALTSVSCKNDKKKEKDMEKKIEDLAKNSPNVNAGTGTFSIEAPAGWTKTDTTMMGFQTVMMMSEQEGPGDNFRENINVVTEKTGSTSFSNYMDMTEKNIAKMLTNYKEKDIRDITVDGVPAKEIQYSHTMQGYNFDVNAVILIKNGIAYVITASVEEGKMRKWQSDIDKTIASFHVN